jgi:hypothetical protein
MISIAESLYDMHVSIFFICEQGRYLAMTAQQHGTATLAYAVENQELGHVTGHSLWGMK